MIFAFIIARRTNTHNCMFYLGVGVGCHTEYTTSGSMLSNFTVHSKRLLGLIRAHTHTMHLKYLFLRKNIFITNIFVILKNIFITTLKYFTLELLRKDTFLLQIIPRTSLIHKLKIHNFGKNIDKIYYTKYVACVYTQTSCS